MYVCVKLLLMELCTRFFFNTRYQINVTAIGSWLKSFDCFDVCIYMRAISEYLCSLLYFCSDKDHFYKSCFVVQNELWQWYCSKENIEPLKCYWSTYKTSNNDHQLIYRHKALRVTTVPYQWHILHIFLIIQCVHTNYYTFENCIKRFVYSLILNIIFIIKGDTDHSNSLQMVIDQNWRDKL